MTRDYSLFGSDLARFGLISFSHFFGFQILRVLLVVNLHRMQLSHTPPFHDARHASRAFLHGGITLQQKKRSYI
jgi:hypothetical protein